jgi:hypothetical protein
MFTEMLHKLAVAIIGVAAGVGSVWYSDRYDQSPWLTAAVAVGATLVLGLLFHPVVWLFRHRPRRRYISTDETVSA